MAKPIKCKVICNNQWGYEATPYEAPSISAGVRWARESGWFWYRVVVDWKTVRRGYGEEWRKER